MRQKPRGTALTTVLVVATLLATLACTLAALTGSQLQLTQRSNGQRIARNLAESIVSDAVARLRENKAFGGASGAVTITTSDDPENQGILTFDASAASSLRIPPSTYNIGVENAATGWNGSIVPADCVQLIGTGRYHGIEHRIEAVVYLPRFPYVIACSGPLVSSGGFRVAAVRDKAAATRGLSQVSDDDLAPGHVVTNADGIGDGKALDLQGENNHVTGDVQACGDVKLSADTKVDGQVRPHADAVRLPRINAQQYSTDGKPGVLNLAERPTGTGPLLIEGYAHRQGDLYATRGLKLDAGVLYIDGNLTVTGGVSGKGAIIVTGSTRLEGGGALETDSMAAVLSKGPIVIKGEPGHKASFSGLMYTESSLQATDVTLVGTLISNGQSGQSGAITLVDADVVQMPASLSIKFDVSQSSGPNFEQIYRVSGGGAFIIHPRVLLASRGPHGGSRGGDGDGGNGHRGDRGNEHRGDVGNEHREDGHRTDGRHTQEGGHRGNLREPDADREGRPYGEAVRSDEVHPAATVYAIPNRTLQNQASTGPSRVGSGSTMEDGKTGGTATSPSTIDISPTNGSGGSTSVEVRVTAVLKPAALEAIEKDGFHQQNMLEYVDVQVDGQSFSSTEALLAYLRTKGVDPDEVLNDLYGHYYPMAANVAPKERMDPPPPAQQPFALDLSEFVGIEEKMRVLSWRDL